MKYIESESDSPRERRVRERFQDRLEQRRLNLVLDDSTIKDAVSGAQISELETGIFVRLANVSFGPPLLHQIGAELEAAACDVQEADHRPKGVESLS